jgi:hypothetical protein
MSDLSAILQRLETDKRCPCGWRLAEDCPGFADIGCYVMADRSALVSALAQKEEKHG